MSIMQPKEDPAGGRGPQARERRLPVAAGKGKKGDSPTEPPGKTSDLLTR